ncbi:MAG: GIN domain-containing protein [Phenylobacterium sp.]
MIRVLVMIAVAGFLVSVVSLSAAVAIGGPDLLTASLWNRWIDGNGHWGWDSDWSDRHAWRHGRDGGPQATRDLAWSGGDTLAVDMPADVRYTQAPGAAKVTVSGPEREVADVEIEDGHIRYGRHHGHWGDLTVVVSAPAVSHFEISSDGILAIDGYKQDKLSLDISGSANVTARGEAKGVELSIAGSGSTDLTNLKVSDADVSLEGSGEATLGPTGVANINIAGSGDVTLLNHPSKLESNVSGSGSIHQKDGVTAAEASPTPPAPPKPPRPPRPPKPV